MIISKLTSKAQTTIPQAVRTALGLQPGDEIAYVLDGERVVLTRYESRDAGEDPFVLFTEWSSDIDAEAYGRL